MVSSIFISPSSKAIMQNLVQSAAFQTITNIFKEVLDLFFNISLSKNKYASSNLYNSLLKTETSSY